HRLAGSGKHGATMKIQKLLLGLSLWALGASQASALQPASRVFKDLPAGHWAEKAVTFVSVERAFMVGYPDHTFRGQKPFTRLQLATATAELIVELEGIAKTRWAPAGEPEAIADQP